MDILISIKPKYSQQIFEGKKFYLFRKRGFKHPIETAYVYETKTTKKIVGQFEVGEIIKDTPLDLWGKYGKHSGLKENKFFVDFGSFDSGYAIEVKNAKRFNVVQDPYLLNSKFSPPRFFYYFDLKKNKKIKAGPNKDWQKKYNEKYRKNPNKKIYYKKKNPQNSKYKKIAKIQTTEQEQKFVIELTPEELAEAWIEIKKEKTPEQRARYEELLKVNKIVRV